MNSRQQSYLKASVSSEQQTLRKLKKVYEKARDDINDKIAGLIEREKAADENTLAGIIYQRQYQEALRKQINGILDTMESEQFKTISDYVSKSYEDGFVGTMYDLHGQGIPLVIPIDERQAVKAIQLDSKISSGLYERLGEDVDVLKRSIAYNVSRGIAQNSPYIDIAKNIAGSMTGHNKKNPGGALWKAMRIARTEAHRVANTAHMDAQIKAKEKGADILKQWDATLDARTRDSHKDVDGELKKIDEEFSNGLMFPGDPDGSAAEVINCRCTLLQRAKWARGEDELQALKERAEYFGLDKSEGFEDFKKKYIDVSKNEEYNKNKFKLSDKQFGKKVGKHAKDFDLDPGVQSDRDEFLDTINNIVSFPDEVVKTDWRHQQGDVYCYIKGEDVVVLNQNKEFITILRGGVNNARIKNARKRKVY